MFNSACAIIVDNKGRFLLQLRDETAKIHANKWTLFSGRLQKGEKPDNTIARELKEELDVKTCNPIKFGKYRKYVIFSRYVFIVELTIQEPIKVREGKEGKYFTKSQLNSINLARYTKRILNDYITKLKSLPGHI